jgi:hypothetical protein
MAIIATHLEFWLSLQVFMYVIVSFFLSEGIWNSRMPPNVIEDVKFLDGEDTIHYSL